MNETPTHYRKSCDPSAPHRQARNGGDCDGSCFVPVEGLIDPTDIDQPMLGLATTRQLIEELSVRIETDGMLDYRTVDGEDYVRSGAALGGNDE